MDAGRQLRQAVFLDRDGVINRSLVRNGKPYAPSTPGEMEIIPGVPEALRTLREAGFLNIVVTNQPDFAAGRLPPQALDEMHAMLMGTLALDGVKACRHLDTDNCACRKPKAGLLLSAAQEFGVDTARSYMVGDRWRDVAAGHSAGCKCFYIDYGYAEKRPEPPYLLVKSLSEVAHLLLSDRSSGRATGDHHD